MARNGTLDYARLVAAMGIVLFHSGAPGSSIGYAALPFFIMLLVVLALPAARRSSFFGFAQSRVRRLLYPWLFWSAVYGGLKLLDVGVTGAPLRSEFAPWMWVVGTAIHLWFLPFAFVVSLALWFLAQPKIADYGALQIVAVVTGLAVVAMAGSNGAGPLPIPFAQWMFGLPPVLLGVAIACFEESGTQKLVVAGIVMAGLWVAFLAGYTSGLSQFSLAALSLMLCMVIRLPDTRTSRWASDVSLGVYLVHPLVASALLRLTPIAPGSVAMAAGMIVGALAATVTLRGLGRFAAGWLDTRSARTDVPRA